MSDPWADRAEKLLEQIGRALDAIGLVLLLAVMPLFDNGYWKTGLCAIAALVWVMHVRTKIQFTVSRKYWKDWPWKD